MPPSNEVHTEGSMNVRQLHHQTVSPAKFALQRIDPIFLALIAFVAVVVFFGG